MSDGLSAGPSPFAEREDIVVESATREACGGTVSVQGGWNIAADRIRVLIRARCLIEERNSI